MTRSQKRRQMEALAEQVRREERRGTALRRTAAVLLAVGNVLAGALGAAIVLYLTAYGMLRFASSAMRIALVPALAAAVYFTLLYGAEYGLLYAAKATRPVCRKYSRRGLAGAFAVTLLSAAGLLIWSLLMT